MIIKRVTAGLMAAVLMTGALSSTCLAASNETENDDTTEIVWSSDIAVTDNNTAEGGDVTEEEIPYEVTVDEDGNYTYTFGDWEWSTEAEDSEGSSAIVNEKVNNYLNLRSGSGTEYEIIGHLLPGEEVQVVSEDGDWYEVVIPERTGYVYKDYIYMLEEADESGTIDEEFLTMLLFLMMSSMEQTEADTGVALTPSGNLTLVDDIGSSTGEGQQFITLVTKSGNYFYLIIDRDADGDENVHFLNMVDEADLFALMDEDQVASYQAELEAAKTEETVTTTTVVDPTITEDAEEDTEAEETVTEKKSVNVLPIALVLVILVACGGGYFYMQTRKKKTTSQKPDPDADYTEEDDEELEFPEEDEDEYDYSDETNEDDGYDSEDEE